MGTLVTLFFDDPAFVEQLQSGGASPVGGEIPDDPDVAAGVRRIVAAGLREDSESPEADIFGLLWLCRKRCEYSGEIDHFRYEAEDIPELFELQFGDADSPLRPPVCEETGLPAVNHWPAKTLLELAEQVNAVDIAGRPEYTHAVFAHLKRWLGQAVRKRRGLLVFTEG